MKKIVKVPMKWGKWTATSIILTNDGIRGGAGCSRKPQKALKKSKKEARRMR